MSFAAISPGILIKQSEHCFKLTSDSALLAGFAVQSIAPGRRVLDLGCGIGCIGAMMMLRHACTVDGVDISPEAISLARENYNSCGFSGVGRLINCNVTKLPADLCETYDACVSNPPYFVDSKGASSQKLPLARASNGEGLLDFCKAASLALRHHGDFFICLPPERLPDLMSALSSAKFGIRRIAYVHQHQNAPAHLLLAHAKKQAKNDLTILAPILRKDSDGNDSDRYVELSGQAGK